MTRADIMQIIFGIETEEIDIIKDLIRERCKTHCRSDCSDCVHDGDDNSSLCPVFWTQTLLEDEWKDCVQRFTILYNTYTLGHNHGYLEGVKYQHNLESGDTNDNN